MCGIYCSNAEKLRSLKDNTYIDVDYTNETMVKLLRNRGPDSQSHVNEHNLIFQAFVLWQQGHTLKPQPIQCGDIIFLFNGDIYQIDNVKCNKTSDTEWLALKLSDCHTETDIVKTLHSLEGPFSFILYKKTENCIYFGRDALGRNSLLIEYTGNEFSISSTSCFSLQRRATIIEVPPLGVFKMNVKDIRQHMLLPWSGIQANNGDLTDYKNILNLKVFLKDAIKEQEAINITEETLYNFYELCSSEMNYCDIIKKLFLVDEICQVLKSLNSLLEKSVKDRVLTTPKFCKACISEKTLCKHSKIAILFSGGVDSSILAVLADKFVDKTDPIDLLNVAFENSTETKDRWNVPDRITARTAYEKLLEICPIRKWNFVEINISRRELDSNLDKHIKHLIYPLKTVLDESIGAAFWFAAKGIGKCNNVDYESPSRVILVGSGADELFGGYIRHRNAFVRCNGDLATKLKQVENELKFDLDRLPKRNLGRDDRVISDHGRTPRAPFVEETLVDYVKKLKSSQKCCFLLREGVGDKLLLRLYAYKLGLNNIAFFKKKAIQFGSRVANSKQKATDKSIYF